MYYIVGQHMERRLEIVQIVEIKITEKQTAESVYVRYFIFLE